MNLSNSYYIKHFGTTWVICFTEGVATNGTISLSDGYSTILIALTTTQNTALLVVTQMATTITANWNTWKVVSYSTYGESGGAQITINAPYNREISYLLSDSLFANSTAISSSAATSDKYVEDYQTFASKWSGLDILTIDNFDKSGKAKNIYTESWIDSDTMDYYIPGKIYHEQPEINITFIIRDCNNHSINVETVHNDFIDYMLNGGYTIKSLYANKSADFVCLKEYAPTYQHIKRAAGQNVISGTLSLQRLTNNETALT